jgi:hypothetical protein
MMSPEPRNPGGDEGALVDQAVLKREQPEEPMAVGGGQARLRSSSVERVQAPSLRGLPTDQVASERLSHVRQPFSSAPRRRDCRRRRTVVSRR